MDQGKLFGPHQKSIQLAQIIRNYKSILASKLKFFINSYDVDLLVVANTLAIPMHIPLGLALTDVIADTGIPTIAHHHDFYWERIGSLCGKVYQAADIITYPSLYEGYGNAFLEAIYFKKPILVNRYKVFIDDIEPKGFELVTMNGYLTDDVVRQTANILNDKQRPKEMVDHNYRLALEHYSYASLRKQLALIEPKIFKSYSLPDNDFPQSAMGI